jgi:Lysophospholipase
MSTVIAAEGTFESAGLQIFFRSWRPSLAPRAAVVIVPGFNSHSAYYAWTLRNSSPIGWRYMQLDLRGRGKSDGERFYVETFDDYVSDVSHAWRW